MVIRKVQKRTGEIVPFSSLKITSAIEKAMLSVSELDKESASQLTVEIVATINSNKKTFFKGIPGIEDIQNVVEETLMRSKFQRAAKSYMLYRKSRAHAREMKEYFKIKDDLKLDVNAIKVLQERYLLKNENGEIIETPTELLKRVARTIAHVDKYHGESIDHVREVERDFFKAMSDLEFMPNTPTLFNAETEIGQLSACFVLPIEDSLESIFATLKHTAMIQQSGGGTGFSFSHLRPRGDLVKSTSGIASGPVSFIKIYDQTTEVIKQGGKRRGANMAVLHVSHPDILEFITAKKGSKQLNNFNISVAVDDKFMKAVEEGKEYPLINPRTKKVVKKIDAGELFNLIAQNAWETGDPGMIFIDEINRKSTVPKAGIIEATNPCGEVPLLPYESCNLGSINLAKVYDEDKKDFDWAKLQRLVRLGVHFLDNVIDANRYPFPELENMAKANRRIGLGVMGFADLLIKMKIPYDSPQTITLAEKIMKFISEEADKKSVEIAQLRGSFPNFEGSTLKKKFKAIRNCARTTIAPTGTISIISGCSSGIEPLFAVAFVRNVMSGKRLFEVNKEFQRTLVKEGVYSEKIIDLIAKQGNLKGINLPEKIKRLFTTALEISPAQHIKIQAAFQRYIDNAVSKTINLPNSAKPEDVAKAYMQAYKSRCKGITVYRYGSKPTQVLYLGEGKRYTSADMEFSGGTCIGKVCSF